MVPTAVRIAIKMLNADYTSRQLSNNELWEKVRTIVTEADLDGVTIKEALRLLCPGAAQIVDRRMMKRLKMLKDRGLLPSQQREKR